LTNVVAEAGFYVTGFVEAAGEESLDAGLGGGSG
jgi:hypothetical protein